MQSRKIADTSWLYALFDEADPLHQRANRQAGAPGLYQVPSEILSEALALRYARARVHKRRAATAFFESILDAGFQVTGTPDPAPAIELHRAWPTLSYPGCVAVIQAAGAELLTFDRRQARVFKLKRAA